MSGKNGGTGSGQAPAPRWEKRGGYSTSVSSSTLKPPSNAPASGAPRPPANAKPDK